MRATVRTLLNNFTIVITFALDIQTPFECFGAHRYEQQLLFWLVAPLGLVLVVFGIGVLKECFKPSKHTKRTSTAAITWALPLVFKLMVCVCVRKPVATARRLVGTC